MQRRPAIGPDVRQCAAHACCLAASVLALSTAAAQPAAGAPAVTPKQPAGAQPDVTAATAPSAAAAPASAEPNEAVQAEYRDVVARAVAEFGAGRWAEARALFLRAHELWPSARTYRTLGMTSFELRAYARALAELQAALDDPRRPLEPAQRQEVLQLVERTRPFVGRYRVRLSPADASLLVDGAPQVLDGEGVLVLEVGSHELLARAAGHAELRRRLDVQGREDQELTLELIAQAPQAPAAATAPAPARDQPETDEDGGGRLWTWIAGGTAIVLAGTATGLWLASDAEYDEEFAKCNDDGVPTCGDDEVDGTWEDLETASYVSAGFAIGAGVAAVTLFFLEGADEEAPIAVPGPGGVQVRARF